MFFKNENLCSLSDLGILVLFSFSQKKKRKNGRYSLCIHLRDASVNISRTERGKVHEKYAAKQKKIFIPKSSIVC